MTKTNHQRGFKARKETEPLEGKFYFSEQLPISGKVVDTEVHLHNAWNGQARKARAAAKRRVNRIARKQENLATKNISNDGDV